MKVSAMMKMYQLPMKMRTFYIRFTPNKEYWINNSSKLGFIRINQRETQKQLNGNKADSVSYQIKVEWNHHQRVNKTSLDTLDQPNFKPISFKIIDGLLSSEE